MSVWTFDPAPRPSLPVVGSPARVPVRRILCVGQNYAAHAREMGSDRAEPFFFSKPGDALVSDGGDVAYPPLTANLHHEVELVCVIGAEAFQIDAAQSSEVIFGWAVGVDMTRRDLQAAAKEAGRPWDASKGFDQSAPCGAVTPGALPDPAGAIALTVDGGVRQSARLDDMVWNPAEIVAQASRVWRLMPGDLIFTGTPEGVGPLVRGDRVEASIAGLEPLAFTVR